MIQEKNKTVVSLTEEDILASEVAEVNRKLEAKTKADMESFVKQYEALVDKFKMKLEAKVIITESGVKAGVDIVLLK